MYQQPTTAQINATLRAIRRSKSLSLSDVEAMSEGRIKAVVLGSYERGARSLSVNRALQIAELYQVPISEIFGQLATSREGTAGKMILDLRLISKRAAQEGRQDLEKYERLLSLLQRIVRDRQDWNGEVISLRHTDIATLALLFDEDAGDVRSWIEREQISLKLPS
jgi:transcriptional regulator with XRE-family HTH domain